MYVQSCAHPNGVLVVCDQRQKSDLSASEQSDSSPTHVLAFNAVMRACFGKAYSSVTRLALYEYGQKPTKAERAEARAAYRQWLVDHAHEYKTMIVLPTPSQAMSQEGTVKGTQVWRDLAPPDSLDEMRGTWWDAHGLLICPVFAPIGAVGQLQLSFTRQWCQAALALAKGTANTLQCDPVIEPSLKMIHVLESMKRQTLAVDIETIPNSNKITAIGVATLGLAVSIPFDEFEPACGSGLEPSLADSPHGVELLKLLLELLEACTIKLLQNGTYDIPLLKARGIEVNGPIHDTLAMHAIAYPESRHALQIATATQLIVPPWKSLFKPQDAKALFGSTLSKDTPEYWYWEAKALRRYNAQDAFYTRHLGEALAWKVEVALP